MKQIVCCFVALLNLVQCSSGGGFGTRQFGVSGKDTVVYGVAADPSGNVFMAGSTTGGLDSNTLTGNKDFFVTKYNGRGEKQWTKQLGVAGVETEGYSSATDSNGNVVIAGRAEGGLGGNSLTGNYDFFVTKYNGTGQSLWTRQGGVSSSGTEAKGVAVDSYGNILVVGTTTGGLNGNTLTGTQDSFVAKYSSSGVLQWTKQLGASGGIVGAAGVTTDSTGNVFMMGSTDAGLNSVSLTGTQDFFVVKYNSSGVQQWTRLLGVSGLTTMGTSVATDSQGNVFIQGYTGGGIDGNTLAGTIDFFVTKYNNSGIKQWTRQLGVSGASTFGLGVATDSSGNIFVQGYTDGSLDGNSLTGTHDFFLTKYNNLGIKQWTRQFGVSGKNTYGDGVACDRSGNVFLGGHTDGGLDGNVLTGSLDAFLVQYDGAGGKQ